MGTDTLVASYLAAWNEPDPVARQRRLEQVWELDGSYTDPNSYAANRAGLDAVIAQFHGANPGAKFTLTGECAYHHQFVRFYWRLRLANGAEIPGMDYGEISAEGRLVKIVGFF